ncbi:hypothetical protein F5Y16DRAFT_77328 [Xylariaceae sp. FL0255]|nr:hypothetical protein F5Y16DRAFT_77328 [Xylariaceae sp. FL0255]
MDPEDSSSNSDYIGSASLRALGIQYILELIAEQLNNRRALYNACLVNQAFNDAFSRQLYCCLRWDRYSCRFLVDKDKRHTLFQHNRLAYTRTFIITNSAVKRCMLDWDETHELEWPDWDSDNFEDVDADDSDEEDRGPESWRELSPGRRRSNPEDDLPMWFDDQEPDNWDYQNSVREPVYAQLNEAIIEICRRCSNLKVFACRDVLLSSECVQKLSNISTIERLSIDLPDQLRSFFGISYRRQPSRQAKYLTRRARYGRLCDNFIFSNLKKLTILNICEDLMVWRSRILQILIGSPHLEELSLSIAYGMVLESNHWEPRDAEDSDHRVHRKLLSWVASEYRRRVGRMLELSTLRLGDGILLPDDILDDINPGKLRNVYLKNKSDRYEDPPIKLIPWWLFIETSTPNLQILSLSELNTYTSEAFEASTRSHKHEFGVQINMFSLGEEHENLRVQSLVSLKATKIMLPWLFQFDDEQNRRSLELENWTEVTDFAFSIDDYSNITFSLRLLSYA